MGSDVARSPSVAQPCTAIQASCTLHDGCEESQDDGGATVTDTPETPATVGGPDGKNPRAGDYWRKNLQYLGILLAVWFAVSYGAGILFVEQLNRIRIPGPGFPLGFWFAQQGSIYAFMVLIFVYVFLMNRLDREFDVDEGGE